MDKAIERSMRGADEQLDPAGGNGRLRELILSMGDRVDAAISQATLGLVNRDPELCNTVIRDDHLVNDLQREAGQICFDALQSERPGQAPLREILGFLHMASELERMGDHAVNIARIGRTLADFPDLRPAVDIPLMSQYCADQVRDMLGALVARDVDRAREIAARDDRVDRVYSRLLDDLLHLMSEDSTTVFRGTNYILVAHNLERIADRVTNLAEDLVFMETGEIKELG